MMGKASGHGSKIEDEEWSGAMRDQNESMRSRTLRGFKVVTDLLLPHHGKFAIIVDEHEASKLGSK